MEKNRKIFLLLILTGFIWSANGCTDDLESKKEIIVESNTHEKVDLKKSSKEQEKLDVNKGESDMLIDLLECDEKHVDKIKKIFEKVTEKKIGYVEQIYNDKKSKIIKVEADDKYYYLEISPTNILEEIRMDDEDGEILYQVNY